MYAFIIIVLTLVATVASKQSGGGPCKQAADCGGSGKGLCEEYTLNGTETVKHCVCFTQYSAPDCSYEKKSKSLLAGLQIGLAFVTINGVGNKLAGYESRFLAQLLMGLSSVLIGILLCCLACCGIISKSDGKNVIGGVATCLTCIASLLMICAWAWGIADGAAMLNDPNWVDANGYPLY